MVQLARQRGVDARVLRIEDIGTLRRTFDGAISNFGAINCVERLCDVREPLARLIRSDGHLVLCVMGRFCLWESLWFGLHGAFRKAARRWSGKADSSLGIRVYLSDGQGNRSGAAARIPADECFRSGSFRPPFASGSASRNGCCVCAAASIAKQLAGLCSGLSATIASWCFAGSSGELRGAPSGINHGPGGATDIPRAVRPDPARGRAWIGRSRLLHLAALARSDRP